eukprot:4884373-Pyramimonas_sp.AAC.1
MPFSATLSAEPSSRRFIRSSRTRRRPRGASSHHCAVWRQDTRLVWRLRSATEIAAKFSANVV